jgi:hypothetical protein
MISGEQQLSFDELVDELVSQAITSAKDHLREAEPEEIPSGANGKSKD